MDKQRNTEVFRQQMKSYFQHLSNISSVTKLMAADTPIHS
jgi:lipase chaperone LimK